jgi:hypothetical protein
METIIKKYYLAEGSKLVNIEMGNHAVDCWFDAGDIKQHRCLSFEDYDILYNIYSNASEKSSKYISDTGEVIYSWQFNEYIEQYIFD